MLKQIAAWIVCLGLVIAFVHRVQAFEFDVWNSGIAMDEALKIAEINDIPLSGAEFNRPLQRGRDHFRSDMVTRAKKSRNLCYQQNLLGATALVTLHFTPMSKKLSNLHVHIRNADRAQQKEAVFALSEKYGEPLKYRPEKDALPVTPAIKLENGIAETQTFSADRQNLISVQYIEKTKSSLIIIYNNISLSRQEQAEAKTFEQYLKTRYRQQDENRM